MKIYFTIDRFEGEQAILKTQNGETVLWPKNKLSENAEEGSTISFTIAPEKDSEQENKKLAKDILNEILETQE